MKTKTMENTVKRIIANVRKDGDKALFQMIRKFDGVKLTPKTIRVSSKQINGAFRRLDPEKKRVIETCARQIQEFHWNENRD